MPSLKSIRTRIASVKSTQKITRAMKLVSAARLRRAQDAILAARPYADALAETVGEMASRAGAEAHPLMAERPVTRIGLIAITSDRGLAGGFNANVFRSVGRFQSESSSETTVSLFVVGKKGRDYFRRRRVPAIAHEVPGAAGDTAQDRAKELAQLAVQAFAQGQVDKVLLVYNEFKSAVVQRVVMAPLLPVLPPSDSAAAAAAAGRIDLVYEPGKADLLSALIPLYVESQIYRALLESIASEFGARMTAMDNATSNAKEMIASLTLQYNRARQAAITKELMEIVGGAEALQG